MLTTVISGGQTGTDFWGISAAKKCGFKTGGTMPKGCRTQDGPRFDLLEEYGMKEHSSPDYPGRTEANVKDSDATIRFASNFKSAGEKLTLNLIKWYNKPYLDIDANNPSPIAEVIQWLKDNKVSVLNIAGNSEQTSPGIGEKAYKYFVEVFQNYN